MAALLPGESSHCAISAQAKPEEGVGRWYFTRKEIEENSPSRRHGIDLKKETYLRKSYCTFLQDLGMRLNVPQITIATAITFCHRFFLRQSHAKNDRRTIGIVCMFLAGKVEETPCPLKDVILVSYEIIHKKDPTSAQRIKQKEVYEQQKEIILLGERVVLATLGFDLNVHHPYKPVVHAIKKFEVARNALAQVAQNFVNDGLRTLLCLQFKPHHIAAGAIFLAAKLLKVKLPSDGEKVWWQEFDVTPWQLEEVCNQMLELYEQNRVPPSQGSEVEGSPGGGPSQRAAAKTPAVIEEHASKQSSLHSVPERLDTDSQVGLPGTTENQDNVNGSVETDSVITDHKVDVETKDNHQAVHVSYKENMREVHSKSRSGAEQYVGEDQIEGVEAGKWRDDAASCKSNAIVGRKLDLREGPVSQSPKEVIKKIDKDRVKAALEKRRKSRGEMTRKKEVMDGDDLIERELEDGVELAAEDEKTKREKGQSWSKFENPNYGKDVSRGLEVENAEEGLEDASPMSNRQKRKAGSTIHTHSEGKKQHHYMKNYNQDDADDNQELCG